MVPIIVDEDASPNTMLLPDELNVDAVRLMTDPDIVGEAAMLPDPPAVRRLDDVTEIVRPRIVPENATL